MESTQDFGFMLCGAPGGKALQRMGGFEHSRGCSHSAVRTGGTEDTAWALASLTLRSSSLIELQYISSIRFESQHLPESLAQSIDRGSAAFETFREAVIAGLEALAQKWSRAALLPRPSASSPSSCYDMHD
eukprot:4401712-Amphidinium_carterae.2